MRRYGLYFAWVVSVVAMLGSLYFSEIRGFEPCKLCWLQRICMYPLPLLLGIAAYRGERGIIPYTLPLAVIGGAIALYHTLEQKIPALARLAPCTVGVPCNRDYLDGFVTIPMMALTAFALIIVFLAMARREPDEN
ncbi:disulfide oxidoreductase [Gordoniibacillus kamchatkensis]|uniref:Disulfide oxidoreductase n=1 Tax=Gordoniibacillus kamchatkensis TaxID=1590651 RepID=A0ABR5AFY0_9BACL|nr:disulfide oxidoreductase [Paenibacillus sp. VKM B-2647]KIL39954.1 disulfide oxidoreductase [Paenibacillus sp. VKM B-2647]